MSAVRKTLGILVNVIALVGVVAAVVLATRRIDERPRTDDGYLQADLVHMAPDVSGRIVELDVRDNQAVRRGDVLFRIDPDPYRMRVDQARAAVQGLEAKLPLVADQVASQTSKADAAARGIVSAEAQRALASSTLGRTEPLLGPGFVTAQQVDQARTAQRTAQLGLQQARLQADEARQAITNTKPTEAELEGARGGAWSGGQARSHRRSGRGADLQGRCRRKRHRYRRSAAGSCCKHTGADGAATRARLRHRSAG